MSDQHGVTSTGPFDELVKEYRGWLTIERGLSAIRVNAYVREARRFLRDWDGRDLKVLALDEVTSYVVEECRRRRSGSARDLVTGLRSLLGYLYLKGITDRQLAPAVPTRAGWRGSWLPKGLTTKDLAALLAVFDDSTAMGRRDYAIVVLLARLGLRAGEVSGLRLDDLDWARGEIVVHATKANRTERLPLPVDVGEALVAYLRDGRPSTTSRAVFIQANGREGLLPSGVSAVVSRAVARAGLASGSAQRLRHSAGTAMLRAGASLAEVGQVLRHRSGRVTAHYAKVDFAALRGLALPWPEGVA